MAPTGSLSVLVSRWIGLELERPLEVLPKKVGTTAGEMPSDFRGIWDSGRRHGAVGERDERPCGTASGWTAKLENPAAHLAIVATVTSRTKG
jgi:hypothetical protein